MSELSEIQQRLRDLEVDRIPDLANEVAKLSAVLERELIGLGRRQDELARKIHEHYMETAKVGGLVELAKRIDENVKVLNDHHRLLWGDEREDRQRAGLIPWRWSMEKRHKQILAVLVALGTAALALLKDMITRLVR
jgi:hypothetical protein